MSKLKASILTVILLVLAIGLVGYFFMQKKHSQAALSFAQAELSKKEMQSDIFLQLASIDTLFLSNDSEAALELYQNIAANSSISDEATKALVHGRINLAQYVIGLERMDPPEIIEDSTSLDLENLRRELAESRSTLPDQPRMDEDRFDSLTFALDKAHMEAERLKNLLKRNTSGNYLTFSSSKGNMVYYVGAVLDKQANGSGVGILSTGSRYEGEWRNNLKDGQGIFHWPDGASYEGTFEEDRRHGEGTYLWPNGERFVGEWQNDLRNGEGTFYGKDGKVVASGQWADDELIQEK